MKLVFYSGGYEEENELLDEQLSYLLDRRQPKLTYIPSSSYQAESEFRHIVDQFSCVGIKKFLLFPIDIPFDDTFFKEVLTSDVIFLGGGNTYYFLKCLRQKRLLQELKRFISEGGILAGLSAGAIIMTPNIATAGYPSFDKDDNDVNLKNLNALRLVNFEFFPHYRNSHRYNIELKHQSTLTPNPIYACPDGTGIVIDDEIMTFVGKVTMFYRGEKINLRNNMPQTVGIKNLRF